MKELSLHVLDIIENSIRAGGTVIKLEIDENIKGNILEINIEDNGKGMSMELVNNLKNPFITTRTTRKLGLGIPLLQEATSRCDGYLDIESEKGKGTKVKAVFAYDHIDRAPLGNINNTLTMLILSKPEIRYILTYMVNDCNFIMDTDDIKEVLGCVPINDLNIIKWLEDYLNENVNALKK